MQHPTSGSRSDAMSLRKLLATLIILLLGIGFWWGSHALTTTPEGVDPMDQIDFKRLVGRWYEIGRLENEVEAGFGQAILNIDLSAKNRFDISLADAGKRAHWEAKADFDSDSTQGSVFIDCFGWLACGYHIVALDTKGYNWILVSGHNFKQLWLFSRASWMEKSQLKGLINKVDELGYDSSAMLIHNPIPETPRGEPESSAPSRTTPSVISPNIIPPEMPANEPPVPLNVPEVPTQIPAIPKAIPVVPTDMPQIGRPPDPYIPPPEEMSEPKVK